MKRMVFVLLLCLLVVGCENGVDEREASRQTMEELQQKIDRLEQEKQRLQTEVERFQAEKQSFAEISNLAYQFVEAHTSGDREAMRKMLGNRLTLTEREDGLYISYPYEGEEVEWRVYQENSPYVYENMLIQGFEYVPEEEIYRVHIREFYADRQKAPVSPPTFLNLTFQRQDHKWKIVSLTFDV